MSDDVVRLSVIGQILRRRWRLLLALAALGAVVGTTASLLWPPAYESGSRVLLQQEELGKDRVLSEAAVAMSLVVLDRAAAGLNWGIDGPGLRGSVTAAVADGNVIEIKATADSPDRARQLAEQVTQQYVAFSTEILTKSASASGELLAPRKEGLQKQVEDMNRRISELQGSAGTLNADDQGAAARAELQRLISNRTESVKELSELDTRIATAQAQTAASRENFSIIEPPVAPSDPVPPTRLQLVAGGAVLAAVLGAVVLVGVRHADRRLRRGSDIAAALGAPVLGVVEAPTEPAVTSATNGSANGHDADSRQSLLQKLLHGSASWDVSETTASSDQSMEYLRYRRVLARLRGASDEPARILVVVVDDDALASRAVGRLAIAATKVDVSTGADQSRSTGAAVHSVVSVSAARPTVPDSHEASGVLVVVTSGTRTAWELLAVAEACHDAGHPVEGALVVLPRTDQGASPELRHSAEVGSPAGRTGGGPA